MPKRVRWIEHPDLEAQLPHGVVVGTVARLEFLEQAVQSQEMART